MESVDKTQEKLSANWTLSCNCFREIISKFLSSFAIAVLVSIFTFSSSNLLQSDAAAQEFEYGEIAPVFKQSLRRDGHISFGPVDPVFDRYFQWKENLAEGIGLNFVIEDRMINQWGDGASIYDNEINVIARWDLVESSAFGNGSFNVWGQFAQSIGGKTGSKFQSDLGVLSPMNGGNGGPSNTNEILHMLAWEQIAPGAKFRVQAGKLAARTLVNLNRYANGDSEMFFSPMLGNNPVVPYTALLGIGVFAQWKEEDWYVSGFVRGADTETGISFDAISDGDLQYVAEAAWTPTFEGLGQGEYRFTFSYDVETATRPQVLTYSLSTDQDLGERFGAFFRYAYGDGTFRAFDYRIAGGFQLKEPLGFRFDRLGVGAWWGNPSNSALGSETGLEVFYKAQIKPFLELTPDVQLVINPALSNDDFEAVVGLRFRLTL